MHTSLNAPLAGIRILDFTRVLSGPMSTVLLADLGAEVIKVEPPHGDDYRAIGPMKNGHSALFSLMNRNKKSIVLDLKCPEAVAIVHALCQKVDVVVENFRPGVAKKLGIDAETLRQHNPKLVYASISGFGQTGPYAHRPAYDIIVQAMSGLMEATGQPDGPPTLVGEAVSDVISGIFASWGILAALLHSQKTGQGQHLDVGMLDSTLAFIATSMARYLFTGKPAKRVGNRHPLSAPFGIYKAADGHFALAVLNNKLFTQLCSVMSLPELAKNPSMQSDELRSEHEAYLRECIEQWASTQSIEQVVQALDEAGIPAAPIWNIEQALQSEHVQQRQLLHAVPHPDLPDLLLPTQPVRFQSPTPVPQPAPALGQDTDHLLQQLLHCSAEQLHALRATGALG